MKILPLASVLTLALVRDAYSATVQSGAGYTNDFSSQPPAADWPTRSFGTAANAIIDAVALDAAVQTNSAGLFTERTTSNNGNPPANLAAATWSSTGFYLQTRPTQNAATLLMLSLTNNTGTNATAIRIQYDFVTNRAAGAVEEVRGQRVFYSLSGATNSWLNIPALSQTTQGTLSTNLTLSATWTNEGPLYLLWADDNGSGMGDDVNDIDNFFVTVIAGTPLGASCQLNSPTNGVSYGFHLPVPLAASPNPGPGATTTGVGFYDATNGFLTNALTVPYTNGVTLAVGTYAIFAVATNSLGVESFSGTNTIYVVVPPTNATPPTILGQVPVGSATVSNLTSIQVFFTENVINVDGPDLLVNDVSATGVSGTGSNYVFTFPQPAYGTVSIRFDPLHGITDIGYPMNLGFYQNVPEAFWSYSLVDLTRPAVTSRSPVAGATVTNLSQVSVTFSEAVTGVDAGDLLLNGVPAYDVSGSGSNYTFSVSQPAAETVNVTWFTNHGIVDLSPAANAFIGTNAGWSFALDAKTVLIQSNSFWLFVKGTNEASIPTNAWRQIGFDDSSWSNAPAPFFYGDPYSNGLANFTLLSDMQGLYSSINLRKQFTLPNVVTNLLLRIQIDDGLIAWINGTEVFRTNVFAGEPSYTNGTPAQGTEPNNQGAGYVTISLTNVASYVVAGTNVLAIQAFNQSVGGSSDFGFNAQLYTLLGGPETVAPTISSKTPAPGYVFALTNIVVHFSEPVTNVDAGDLLVNGVAATGLMKESNTVCTFSFAQPAFGSVNITWDPAHGIMDQDPTPKPFNENGPGATWSYTLLNPDAPVVFSQFPIASTSVTQLTQVAVTFSKLVTGANAADLLVNGVPATGFSGAGSNFVFTFTQPAYGAVATTWAANHDIQDLSANAFAPGTPGNTWNYTLLDQIPPTVLSQTPTAGSFVANLTSITVNFSESVSGVNATDLRVNGIPASGVSGGGSSYTFTVPPLNATSVNVTWAVSHGIADFAATPNAFDATGPGATWSYTTTDSAAPSATVFPTPSLTVQMLTHINVTFDEPVVGVNAGDLLINSSPATAVSGSGAGPYVFTFPQPATGTVSVAWAGGHGITDQAAAPNAFAGGAWSYTLDPNILGDYAVTHVVQMSLDGCAAVHLRFYITNAPDQFPNFVRLVNEGAWTMNARCDYEYSETVPNHATMFMARPVTQPTGAPNTVHHGYNNNFPGAAETFHNSGNLNVPYKASMMDVAHDYGRNTALYTGKTRLDICDRSFNDVNGALDLIGADNGRDKIDFSSIADVSGTAISNEVNTLIADLMSGSPKHYSFIHIAEPDLTGHSSSWGSANWSNAVRMVDTQIGRILDAIDTNPVLSNQTVLIITADHGGGGVTPNAHTEAYHVNNYTIPFFVRAPSIRGGTDAYALFLNRGNPGTNRTDYTTQPQPIRNGDASNLALSFLGLPPIPGSFIVSALNTPLNTLRVTRFGSLTTVFWYDPNNDSVLEAANAVGTPAAWQPVTSGVIVSETTKSYSVTNGVGSQRFFRVRKL